MISRQCAQCKHWRDGDLYSNNQWRKGDGASRCNHCLIGFVCPTCHISFNNANQLKMHLQVHRPKYIVCPVCQDQTKLFASGANAVQHVESGYCTGCQGSDNAREAIYKFAAQKKVMQRYLTEPPRITWHGEIITQDIPYYPYTCKECGILYHNLSSLLQHQENKHGSSPLRIGC